MIINIQRYGDYDMPYTEVSMLAPNGMTKKVAKQLVSEAEEMFKDTDETDGAVRYLKDWGFTSVKSYNIAVGGNL